MTLPTSGCMAGMTLSPGKHALHNNMLCVQVVDEVKGEGNAFAATGSRLLAQAIARAFGPEKDRSALDCAAKFEDGLAVQVRKNLSIVLMGQTWAAH